MKKAITRLFFIELTTIIIAGSLNYINYYNYWHKTIFRTQTVDFNILSNTLPTKLSYALQNNNFEALQETLNSNYELFGLVVTDCKIREKYCSNQNILYLSASAKKPSRWREKISLSNLQNYPYNLLQNPPPLYAEWSYSNPHSKDNEIQLNKKVNKGKIIGRVYYVRGVPPTYLNDINRWLQNPFIDSGPGRLYFLSLQLCLLAGFSTWIFIEMLLYKKNIKEKELLLEEKYKRIEVENRLARTRGFIGGIQEVIEQDFSSVIANRLQELESIFRRINTDVDNITHDMRKAPLIRSVEDNSLGKLSSLTLKEAETNEILSNVTEYVKEADETIKSISWAIDELNQIANLESKPIFVQQEIKDFSKNLPPNLAKKWLTIDFNFNSEQILYINCNPWHLKSIVKNALYNSSAALIKSRLIQKSAFQGKISVTCLQIGKEVGIMVEDNGPGFPDQALKKLYQVPSRVDENIETTKGRGSVIVFSYLSLHNGRVELTNRPEGGARAIFLFPLVSFTNSNSQS